MAKPSRKGLLVALITLYDRVQTSCTRVQRSVLCVSGTSAHCAELPTGDD